MIVLFDDGFELQFANGLIIRVKIGEFNYCDNYGKKNLNEVLPGYALECENCEVSIMDEFGNFITHEFGATNDTIGYIKTDDLAELILKVKNYKSEVKESE